MSEVASIGGLLGLLALFFGPVLAGAVMGLLLAVPARRSHGQRWFGSGLVALALANGLFPVLGDICLFNGYDNDDPCHNRAEIWLNGLAIQTVLVLVGAAWLLVARVRHGRRRTG